MFHSIRTRLITTFLLFLALIESSQLFILYFFTNDSYLRQKKETIAQSYDEINDDEFDDPEVYNDIVAVMQDYEQTSNLYFTIINTNTGKPVYNTNDHTNSKDLYAKFLKLSQEFEDDLSVHLITGKNSIKWMVMYGTIDTEANSYQTLIWTCYEAEFRNAIQSLFPIVLLTLFISCILGFILAINITGRIVKPIKQIDLTAQNIANQNFDNEILLPKHHDEIYRLAQNISKMSDKLKHDMTTLKEVNEQLENDIEEKRRIDEMRRQFLSNVSHDLKTPIAIISSYAEMIKYEGEHINKDDYLDVIIEESSNMTKMVASLLELSRLEYAADHLELEECNISETLDSLLENRRILFEQDNLTVVTNIEPDLYVLADEFYLCQAFDNYFSNAIKYSKKPGTVTISLVKDGANAVFSVTNPGNPLTDKEQKDIWDSFYKVDKSRTHTNNMSVGLGLYIVKTIVNAHHGTYHVENCDAGIRFSINLQMLENKI